MGLLLLSIIYVELHVLRGLPCSACLLIGPDAISTCHVPGTVPRAGKALNTVSVFIDFRLKGRPVWRTDCKVMFGYVCTKGKRVGFFWHGAISRQHCSF